MDPVTLGFYALICGCLSSFAPQSLGRITRFGIGAAVGLLAASLLPLLHGMLGGY